MNEDRKLNKIPVSNSEDEEGSEGSSQSGHIAFRDFLSSDEYKREDELPPDQVKHLLFIHQELHAAQVKKQMATLAERKALKAAQKNSAGGNSNTAVSQNRYRAHPLSETVQYGSGIDKTVNPVPDNNIADTNEADRNEIEEKYRKTYTPDAPRPVFNPQPRPF